MRKIVRRFIEQERLFSRRDKIAVGVSGGADSVALLALLCELGYDCVALHCNFHLRGEESMRDERFVKQWVESLNIEYRKVDFETEKYAAEQKISIEMAARELRYEWFREQKQQLGAKYIAIAHHADDVAETFLINMTRGSGIHGLTGIKPKNGDIVRPLLCVSRKEITQYLIDKELKHVEDSTNQESIYVRNKFRNNIIPLLQSINPSFKTSLIQTISNLKNTEDFLNGKLASVRAEVMSQDQKGVWRISIEKLRREGNAQFLLFELLQPFGFSSSTVQNIADGLEGESGKVYSSHDYTLQKDRETLILFKRDDCEERTFEITEGETWIDLPMKLRISVESPKNCTIDKSKNCCYSDYGKLKFPLKIRKWQQGDCFVPFGMKGRKKVSDYFIDNRIPLYQKMQTWILLSDNQIVWVMGERSDNRFRISDETEKILKIEICE